jgi:hypothetical protein
MAERIPPRHEATDVSGRTILTLAGLFGGMVVVVIVAVRALFPATLTGSEIVGPLPSLPTPALQTSPRTDMAAFRRQETARLSGYGWIDQGRGVAHIPIDQAMRDVARDGIAGWPAPSDGH